MGRLIDADELKKDYPHDSDWEYPVNTNEYVCESIDNAPTVEAIPKADYENRLKADLKAILAELQLEIEELDVSDVVPEYQDGAKETKEYIANMIEETINSLKEA